MCVFKYSVQVEKSETKHHFAIVKVDGEIKLRQTLMNRADIAN